MAATPSPTHLMLTTSQCVSVYLWYLIESGNPRHEHKVRGEPRSV